MGFDLRGDPAVDAADPAQPAVDERGVALQQARARGDALPRLLWRGDAADADQHQLVAHALVEALEHLERALL